MRRIWLVSTICIAIFSLYSHSAPAQEDLGPKMVLNERVIDFMEVKEGEVIEHVFHVFNQGNETLEIKKVSPG